MSKPPVAPSAFPADQIALALLAGSDLARCAAFASVRVAGSDADNLLSLSSASVDPWKRAADALLSAKPTSGPLPLDAAVAYYLWARFDASFAPPAEPMEIMRVDLPAWTDAADLRLFMERLSSFFEAAGFSTGLLAQRPATSFDALGYMRILLALEPDEARLLSSRRENPGWGCPQWRSAMAAQLIFFQPIPGRGQGADSARARLAAADAMEPDWNLIGGPRRHPRQWLLDLLRCSTLTSKPHVKFHVSTQSFCEGYLTLARLLSDRFPPQALLKLDGAELSPRGVGADKEQRLEFLDARPGSGFDLDALDMLTSQNLLSRLGDRHDEGDLASLFETMLDGVAIPHERAARAIHDIYMRGNYATDWPKPLGPAHLARAFEAIANAAPGLRAEHIGWSDSTIERFKVSQPAAWTALERAEIAQAAPQAPSRPRAPRV